MTNKELYFKFCDRNYVPLYSKPWWLDAVCGPDNWDVWIYGESESSVIAAMPYYFEFRGDKKYITKAPLTQNNGIIFRHADTAKIVAKATLEERIIDTVCAFLDDLNIDVYEQQFETTFTNWLPFFWNGYKAVVRYTYRFEDTSDMEMIWNGVCSKRRGKIKKGQKNSEFSSELSIEQFYKEHNKIYLRQGLHCPFSFELWERVANACISHNAGRISCRLDSLGNVAAVSFNAWDERVNYKLMGGSIPEYTALDAYSALTWDEIQFAHDRGLIFDFEGSVIKRISKSFREFGAVPVPYFRIRKIFNTDVLIEEMEKQIEQLSVIRGGIG